VRRGGRALALLATVACGCAWSAEPEPAPLEQLLGGGYAMGTVLELTLLGAEAPALDAARAAAFEEVRRVEELLSRWHAISEISRLNAAAGTGPQALDPEALALLERCLGFTRTTAGAFDVTVGPLIALWRRAEERGALPGEAELVAARVRVGPGQLEIGSDGRVALEAGSSVDLGAVAKGYALDRVRARLPDAVEAALLNFGQSSTWAIGRPPGEEGWRLLIQAPGGGYAGTIALRDQALSASGSVSQWREIGGRRFGHVIDPRDGQPLTRELQSLVVAGDATLAEAMATAVVVLGPEEGIGLAQSLTGVEALLLDAEGRRWRTRGWDRATRFEELPVRGAGEAG